MLLLDLYCERLGPEAWAEPLNAASNAGFLLAAWWSWRTLPSQVPAAAGALRVLAVLMALVGLASLSFHTFQSPATGLLDVAFIGLFNVCYLMFFGYHVLGWNRWVAGASGAGFIALDQLRMLCLPAGFLHGSGMYFPPLLVLLLLSALARQVNRSAADLMLQAALLFMVSLTARTLDRPLCGIWPYGLHFVWHLLNALVLLQLVRAFAQGACSVIGAGTPRRD